MKYSSGIPDTTYFTGFHWTEGEAKQFQLLLFHRLWGDSLQPLLYLTVYSLKT